MRNRLVMVVNMIIKMLVKIFPNIVKQVDNTGKMEFQEFKVFWDKMKKWIVCTDLPGEIIYWRW